MIRVGADPEVFVMKDGQYISAYGLIPGDKQHPFPIEKGAIQVDGTAAEFNIDPAENLDQWMFNINHVLNFLRARIAATGGQVVIDPVAEFDPTYMETLQDVEKVLGCDPDFNAYTLQANDRPDMHPIMRTAAGHVHVSWGVDLNPHDFSDFSQCGDVTRQLDFFLGLPSVLLDKDTKRKSMYGKAGAFRPKPYGVEYRVCSNFWLKDRTYQRLVYENTTVGLNRFLAGDFLCDRYGDVCEEIINTNDKERALDLCEEAGIPLAVE